MPNTTIAVVILLAASLAGCARMRGSVGPVLVAHDFSTSSEGWLVATDTGLIAATFVSHGGKAGGYISGEDEAGGETWYFRAPDDVLAQLPAARNGLLEYSLKQSSIEQGFPDDDVVIVGAAGRLSYRFDHPPGTGWTDFSVPLSGPGWRWNWSHPATPEQIASVLAHPARLEIRGEFRTGPDVGGLDAFAVMAGK
jgi:hypothetical protein